MAKIISAGIAAYHYVDGVPHFLVCKPGGPYFKNKMVYGFPKGQVEDTEQLKTTAVREFLEETGVDLIDYRKLGDPIKVSTKRKDFYFYFYETPEVWDVDTLQSNLFFDEKTQAHYPENDDYSYMTLDELRTKTFSYMSDAIDQLETLFATKG